MEVDILMDYFICLEKRLQVLIHFLNFKHVIEVYIRTTSIITKNDWGGKEGSKGKFT